MGSVGVNVLQIYILQSRSSTLELTKDVQHIQLLKPAGRCKIQLTGISKASLTSLT